MRDAVITVQVDGVAFHFPGGWLASRYDGWTFYRSRFSRMWNGIQAVDVVVVDPHRIA